jgi:hypothetical protein
MDLVSTKLQNDVKTKEQEIERIKLENAVLQQKCANTAKLLMKHRKLVG